MKTVEEISAQNKNDHAYWFGVVRRRLADLAIRHLGNGNFLSADDLHPLLDDLPDKYASSMPGKAFREFKHAGHLTHVKYEKSKVKSRKGGVIAIYEVAPDATQALRGIVQRGGAGNPDTSSDGREVPEAAVRTGDGGVDEPPSGEAQGASPEAATSHLFNPPAKRKGNHTDPDQREAA